MMISTSRLCKIRLIGSFIVLAFTAVAVHGYVKYGDSLFLVGMIALPVMVLGEWWQQYKSRGDPDWPKARRTSRDHTN
jgi:hypothetical protein